MTNNNYIVQDKNTMTLLTHFMLDLIEENNVFEFWSFHNTEIVQVAEISPLSHIL